MTASRFRLAGGSVSGGVCYYGFILFVLFALRGRSDLLVGDFLCRWHLIRWADQRTTAAEELNVGVRT